MEKKRLQKIRLTRDVFETLKKGDTLLMGGKKRKTLRPILEVTKIRGKVAFLKFQKLYEPLDTTLYIWHDPCVKRAYLLRRA